MVAPDRLVSPLVGLMSGRGTVGRAIVGQDNVGRGKISPPERRYLYCFKTQQNCQRQF